jgi:hypothetical protein
MDQTDHHLNLERAKIWARICTSLEIKPAYPAGLTTFFPEVFPRQHLSVSES